MARNIQTFKSVMGALALQTSFEIQIINLPGAPDGGALVSFAANGIPIPGVAATPLEFWFRGQRGEYPVSGVYSNDVSFECKVDSRDQVYEMVQNAFDLTINPITKTPISWPLYAFAMNVKMLDANTEDQAVSQVSLLDCYIKEIGERTKAHDAQATFDVFNLTVHFDDRKYTRLAPV